MGQSENHRCSYKFLPHLIIISSINICFIPSANSSSYSSSCGIDFSYVQTFPWDTSLCRDPVQSSCCQTLHSLFGMGLAQHLKDTSLFYFADAASAYSCLADFQSRLSAMSMNRTLVSTCVNNSRELVIGPSSCARIATIKDWIQRVGPISPLDSSCYGDLTDLTRCGRCVDAGMKVNAQLASLAPNASENCFFFAILYASGIVSKFGPQDPRSAVCILGLPLARPESNKSSDHFILKFLFGFLGTILGILVAIGLAILFKKWDKKRKQHAWHSNYVSSVQANIIPKTGIKWFHVDQLEQATNGFSRSNIIGQDGYGLEFIGALGDGTIIAVKQILDLDSTGDEEEFINEAEILSKIRHKNLLSLRGCCVTSDATKGKRRYLVYDFMSNGSLNDHLFNQVSRKKKLSWPQRKSIILDVAKGLAYLHYGIKPAIYHSDIKAANILLDSEMNARLANFGLAKQNNEGHCHLTTRLAGTYGYLAPEYSLYGQLTEKSDVYSFGIVILEVMSGRKVLDSSSSNSSSSSSSSSSSCWTPLITDWAWSLVKSGKVGEVFDEGIREEGPSGVMEGFIHVGILCGHVMVALRPTIVEALKMLEGDIDIPRLPDRPMPLGHESFQSSLLPGF